MAEPSNSSSQLFTQLGLSLSSWSHVEMKMTALFSNISDMPGRKAVALFDAIISFEVRLALLDRMMMFETVDDIDQEMWSRFSARLSKAYKKRHQLAHFALTVGQGEISITPFISLDKIIGREGPAPPTLSASQIKLRTMRFIELSNALGWFMNRAAARRSEPGTHPLPTPLELQTVAPLRELALQTLEAKKQRPKPPLPADDW